MVRKWYFAISGASLNGGWRNLIRVAVRSALDNSGLEPHMMYDGEVNDFTDEMQAAGVKVIRHSVSFADALVKTCPSPEHLAIARGAYLRVDIPLVEEEDKHILYTDCDVMFRASFNAAGLPQPGLFACAPERSMTDYQGDINTGSMVMNIPTLRTRHHAFTKFIVANLDAGWPAYDQEHFRRYFAKRWDSLPIVYNWKPYWGENPDAQIVHWHGPKPAMVRRMIEDPATPAPDILLELFQCSPDSYHAMLAEWDGIATSLPQTMIGALDKIDDDALHGWALSEGTSEPVILTVEIDGRHVVELPCDAVRQDLVAIYGRDNAGFVFNIPDRYKTRGTHTVRLLDRAGQPVALLKDGQQQASFAYEGTVDVGVSLRCYIDDITPAGANGWACDSINPDWTAELTLFIDGEAIETVRSDTDRPDVARTGLWSNVGFHFAIPRMFFDDEPHVMQVGCQGRMVEFSYVGEHYLSYTFKLTWRPKVYSHIDGVREFAIKGWVFTEDPVTGKRTGSVNLLVVCDGSHVGHIKANRYRPDVAKTFATDGECGFEYLPSPSFRRGRQHAFHFYVLPYNLELAQSPIVTRMVTDEQEADLIALSDSMDDLHRRVTRLRQQFNLMVPRVSYTLRDYDAWTEVYFSALRKRTLAQRHLMARNVGSPSQEPLVSIICPTFQPTLAHFEQAVQSVIDQTYQNWELIIVDDGSQVPELTRRIVYFTKHDKRIKQIKLAKNGGISSATNSGTKAARGNWVMFFDHDDLLVDVAVEVMVREASLNDAKVIYSDEDKIDEIGQLSEPAFKPDWNYRFALSVNYVSHLTMVDRAVLRRAGNMQPKYDGAQDHALLLRLSELLDPQQIHHVSEVLYHWRKSSASTASSTGAKSYAIAAGIAAVSDHLQRVGKPAHVTNVADTTWYRVNWQFFDSPSVTIIIPFKDQIEMTRECVNRVLAGTDYQTFDVILVDNWSTSPEASEFCAEMSKVANVRVLRIEEPFNYSGLNNAAAAKSNADYFVLMNNDLLIIKPNWLRVMVNECLADPQVAVVGGKYLYPNGTVQHAGVVLGIGGVASHVHTGIGADDPGYAARALLAQEMSAVTAACLLIRSSVFHEIGGLDETDLKVAFNDVDLCLKVRAAGKKVVWTPDFVAEHHESLSRGEDDIVAHKEARFFAEMQTMQSRWGMTLKRDPHYSQHFSLDSGSAFYDLVSEGPPPRQMTELRLITE